MNGRFVKYLLVVALLMFAFVYEVGHLQHYWEHAHHHHEGAHWPNILDISDDGTLEFGGSYLKGPAALLDGEPGNLDVMGIDLTWKWESTMHAHGPVAQISAELIVTDVEQAPSEFGSHTAHHH